MVSVLEELEHITYVDLDPVEVTLLTGNATCYRLLSRNHKIAVRGDLCRIANVPEQGVRALAIHLVAVIVQSPIDHLFRMLHASHTGLGSVRVTNTIRPARIRQHLLAVLVERLRSQVASGDRVGRHHCLLLLTNNGQLLVKMIDFFTNLLLFFANAYKSM